MNRLALAAPLAIIAALFAGCASRGPGSASTASADASIKPVEMPYRAGTGVVQAVTPAPATVAAGPGTSAAAVPSTPGKSTAAAASGLQRLRIRMDDGSMVYVDTPGKEFAPGQRVQLSNANEIRRQ